MKRNAVLTIIAAVVFLGRYPISRVLSRGRKKMQPERFQDAETMRLSRPGGNTFVVAFDGPENAIPIVLIHGLNADSRQWYYQRQLLRHSYRLVLMDLAGHGRSSGPPADLRVEALAADLAYLCQVLQLHNPIFYGHSLGSMLIMQYFKDRHQPEPAAAIFQQSAYRNPLDYTAFGKLLPLLHGPLLSPFLTYVQKHPLPFWLMGWLAYLSGLSTIFYRFIFFTGQQNAADLRLMAKIAAGCPPDVVAPALLNLPAFDATDTLRQIRVPSLVLSGYKDRISRPNAAVTGANKIPGALHAQLPAGHLALVEVPVETNIVLSDFLNRLDKKN